MAVLIGLACVIFALVNDLSSRHYRRLHRTPGSFTRLADKSLQLLATLDGEVRITALVRPSHPAYRSTLRLMQEYAAHSHHISIELLDPDRDLSATEELTGRYRLSGEECVVVDIAGRHQIIPADNLIAYGYADEPSATHWQRAFRGEQLFSGAIQALLRQTRPTVCFTHGHGEHSPTDFDRRRGYSRAAARLRDDNLDVELLYLPDVQSIPAHCDLLIIAGPSRGFAPFEVNLIRDYLDRKGRLLLLLDARMDSGLELLLEDWGVQLGHDVIVDLAQSVNRRDLHISSYPEHAITRPLQNMTTVFSLPRSVRPRPLPPGGDKPVVAELVVSSPSGWAEFSPDDPAPYFDPHVDIAGPVPLALAIERGPVPGVHVQIRPTRLVVVGDSDFASNSGLTGANIDLFLNSVHWLLDAEPAIAIAPKTLDEMQLVLHDDQLHRLFWLVVAGPPAIIMVWGLWMGWRRRR